MASLFDSIETPNIGTSDSTVYSPSTAGVVMSILVSNKTSGALPISVWLVRGANTIKLTTNKRVTGGSKLDILEGSKVAVVAGDIIYAKTAIANGFNCIVSAYKDT